MRAKRSTNVCDGRALRLRLLDEMDDARQRGVASERVTRDVERAAAVDAAGKHVVTGRLVDRQRLAGDRRLVDRLAPATTVPSSGIFRRACTTKTAPGGIASTGTFARHRRRGAAPRPA